MPLVIIILIFIGVWLSKAGAYKEAPALGIPPTSGVGGGAGRATKGAANFLPPEVDFVSINPPVNLKPVQEVFSTPPALLRTPVQEVFRTPPALLRTPVQELFRTPPALLRTPVQEEILAPVPPPVLAPVPPPVDRPFFSPVISRAVISVIPQNPLAPVEGGGIPRSLAYSRFYKVLNNVS